MSNDAVSASGGDGTLVDNSVQGTVTNSAEATPTDKAPNPMAKGPFNKEPNLSPDSTKSHEEKSVAAEHEERERELHHPK